jgi:hypothetical protein
MPGPQAKISPAVDRRMALAREWDDLVAQVRQLDGFADFLRPPRLATLLPAASAGPVVVVNASRLGCAALIVTPNGVRVRQLSTLTVDTITAKTIGYLRVLSDVDDAARTLYLARQRFDDGDHGVEAITRYTVAKQSMVDAERHRDTTLVDVLGWLWDEIADRVLATLGFVEPPPPGAPWPRVWWCPTGALTLLPLHAAGHHDTAGRPVPRTVLDRVVSSYTPTLRALLHARRAGEPVAGDRRLLVVSAPDATGEVPLESAAREREVLASRFPDRHTLLEGTAANLEAVQAELPRHPWAHFICHGGQNLTDPAQGQLLLHDQPLTITDIGAAQHDGEFAFLSACMTATGGLTLPDEAITLAAAMHYTGYRHVIGTLWSVYDDTAADVAQAVYADLTSTGDFAPGRAAHALHKAIKGLRDSGTVPLHAWTPFTHTGP